MPVSKVHHVDIVSNTCAVHSVVVVAEDLEEGQTTDGYLWLEVPEEYGPPPGGPFRPARPGLMRGKIHGQELIMPDYTDAQYETLRALTKALSETFPRLRRRAPRDTDGTVRGTVLAPERLAAFGGVVGHYHLTRSKIDPGPALDWDRILK